MGTSAASQEISAEEMELFEMQVDEQYNPSAAQSCEEAKRLYMERQRLREAEEYRMKYLSAANRNAAKPRSDCHNEPNDSRGTKHKQSTRGRVTYVFDDEAKEQERELQQEHEDLKRADAPAPAEPLVAPDESKKENGFNEILRQKEKIRSIITPQDHDNKPIAAANGRGPYNGAALKVVSIKHKAQQQQPIYDAVPILEEPENGSAPAKAPLEPVVE